MRLLTGLFVYTIQVLKPQDFQDVWTTPLPQDPKHSTLGPLDTKCLLNFAIGCVLVSRVRCHHATGRFRVWGLWG